MTRLAQLWLLVTDIHPALPYAGLPVLIWLVNWAVRTWYPWLWQWAASRGPVGAAASKAWQAVPSALLGAAVAATAGLDPQEVVLAALVSLAAPLWHELLKAATSAAPWLPTYLGGAYPAAGNAPAALPLPGALPLTSATGPTDPPTSKRTEEPKSDGPSVG